MSESHAHPLSGFESGVCPTCGQQVKVVSGDANGTAAKKENREKIEQPEALHYVAGAAIIAAALVFLFPALYSALATNLWIRFVMPFGLAAGASLVMLRLKPRLGVRMIRWTVILMLAAIVIALILLVWAALMVLSMPAFF